MSEPEYIHTLLATVGGQPQVVTFTLDLLLQQHIPISEVHVVHPATSHDPRMERSLQLLKNEFSDDRYSNGQIIHFHSHVLHHDALPLEEITDEASADDVLNTMHTLILNLKERHCIVHFSISGGRRLMPLLSLTAAILSFEHEDRMWHIYTPPPVLKRAKDGALMHVPPEDNVRLIPVPLARLSADVRSQLADIHSHSLETDHPSARDIIRAQEEMAEAAEWEHCDHVIRQLTHRQFEVLQAFAHGLHPSEVATRLSISAPTVSTHTTVLLSLCREAWSIKPRERLDYRFLQLKFGRYLKT
jgi:CRISPR-associated protein Csx14